MSTEIVQHHPLDKKVLFNAATNAGSVKDYRDKELLIHYVIFGQTTSEEGEILDTATIILKSGESFFTRSKSLLKDFRALVAIYGEPETWKHPIKAKIEMVEIEKGRQMNKLELI